jgi:plastocyanin
MIAGPVVGSLWADLNGSENWAGTLDRFPHRAGLARRAVPGAGSCRVVAAHAPAVRAHPEVILPAVGRKVLPPSVATISPVRHGPFRVSKTWLLGGFYAACLGTAFAQQGPKLAVSRPEEPATGTIAGQVTVAQGLRLPEMVVYLESTDPSFTFTPSAAPVVVSQQNAQFAPGLLVVPVGTRIDFRNDETKPVEHNVFSNSEAKKFDLGLYKPGETIAPVLFDVPGVVRLRCSIHRYMDGVVYVTPTPYFAPVEKDGRFSIAGVPPGAYRLKTWQRSQRFREQDVPVSAAAGAAVEVMVDMSRK